MTYARPEAWFCINGLFYYVPVQDMFEIKDSRKGNCWILSAQAPECAFRN